MRRKGSPLQMSTKGLTVIVALAVAVAIAVANAVLTAIAVAIAVLTAIGVAIWHFRQCPGGPDRSKKPFVRALVSLDKTAVASSDMRMQPCHGRENVSAQQAHMVAFSVHFFTVSFFICLVAGFFSQESRHVFLTVFGGRNTTRVRRTGACVVLRPRCPAHDTYFLVFHQGADNASASASSSGKGRGGKRPLVLPDSSSSDNDSADNGRHEQQRRRVVPDDQHVNEVSVLSASVRNLSDNVATLLQAQQHAATAAVVAAAAPAAAPVVSFMNNVCMLAGACCGISLIVLF
jgi:hypothetical protein